MRSRRTVRLALALALLTASLGFAGQTSAASVTGTLKLDQPSYQVDNGGTLNVTVISNASVPISGIAASISFNKSILQVTGITRASGWATAPLFIAGDASAISKANTKGVLQAVGASFFPPTSLPAGDQPFITVAFKAIACGNVTLGLPTGRVDSGLLDGRASTYGNAITIKTTGSTVTACQGGGGASGSPGAPGSAAPGDSSSPGASLDPNASPSTPADTSSPEPSASDSVVASAAPSVAPSDPAGAGSGTTGVGANASSEQNGWLTFALAALAVSAAGLAVLILVLTVVAISAAVIGATIVIRMWRRSSERERAAAAAAQAVAPETTGAEPVSAVPATAAASGEAQTVPGETPHRIDRPAVAGSAS